MALESWRSRSGIAPRRERDMGDIFSWLFRDWPQSRGWSGEGQERAPAVDMFERNDEVVVRADLPGLEQKDINVRVDNGMLTIRGERSDERESKDESYYCRECWSGSFVRSLPLPTGIDPDRIRATFKNGILEVHLPKSKEAAGKHIQVTAG